MAKRLCETKRWEDLWYRKLSPILRNFWDYVCCQCDNAGVWKPDAELVGIYVGTVELEEAMKTINKDKNRIVSLENGYWLVLEYVSFQFGNDIKNPKIRKHVIDLQNRYIKLGYPVDRLLAPPTTVPTQINQKKEDSSPAPLPKIDELISEINDLKGVGWEDKTIKEHFIGRDIPEALVDTAFGKKF